MSRESDDKNIGRGKIQIFIIYAKNILLSPVSQPGQAILGWATIFAFITGGMGISIFANLEHNEETIHRPIISLVSETKPTNEKKIIVKITGNNFEKYTAWHCKGHLATPLKLNKIDNITSSFILPIGGTSERIVFNFGEELTSTVVFDNYSNEIIGEPIFLKGKHICDSFS